MQFDTTQQTDYLINLLGQRRDEIQDSLNKLEEKFTDHVALHANKDFQRHEAERDLNATLTVRIMNDEIQLKRELVIVSN